MSKFKIQMSKNKGFPTRTSLEQRRASFFETSREGVKKMSIQKCLLRQVDERESEELQRMFSAWRTKAFDDVELLRALAQRPELMKVIFAFMKYLYVDSSVEATLMEMLRIKSAWAAKCRH